MCSAIERRTASNGTTLPGTCALAAPVETAWSCLPNTPPVGRKSSPSEGESQGAGAPPYPSALDEGQHILLRDAAALAAALAPATRSSSCSAAIRATTGEMKPSSAPAGPAQEALSAAGTAAAGSAAARLWACAERTCASGIGFAGFADHGQQRPGLHGLVFRHHRA